MITETVDVYKVEEVDSVIKLLLNTADILLAKLNPRIWANNSLSWSKIALPRLSKEGKRKTEILSIHRGALKVSWPAARKP